jgi:hypothetical protein
MEMRRFGLADVTLFLVVLAAAAGARAWYISDQVEGGTSADRVYVQDDRSAELDQLVQSVKRDGSFRSRAPLAAGEEETAHTSPGYPWLLGQAARLVEDGQSLESLVRWAQCGLGALTAGFYFLFARRAFRSLLVGTLAGLFCAVHPFWVINTAELNDGVLASFLLGLCLFTGGHSSQAGGATTSLLYGLGLAGLALVRAALLPFTVVALVWFLFRCRVLKRGWLYALLAFLGFANGLVPWTLRNFQTFDEVVPIVDSAYLHLWIGNNAEANGGPQKAEELPRILASERGERGRDFVERLERTKQPDRYNQLAQVVVDNVADDPALAAERRLSAGLDFVFGADWFPKHDRLSRGSDEWDGVLTGTLLALLLLTVLGWRWTYAWRHYAMPSSLAVIWIPLPYILGHAEALSGPRLPLDGVLLTYAAFALACLIPGVGRWLFHGPAVRREPNL